MAHRASPPSYHSFVHHAALCASLAAALGAAPRASLALAPDPPPDEYPVLVSMPSLEYPEEALEAGVEGTVQLTIVVDRATRELIGAAMACPDASAAIHECVLAIKARVTIDVLAETIHAFPSTSRIFNGSFAEALAELDGTRPIPAG